jgi:hypothetical protein
VRWPPVRTLVFTVALAALIGLEAHGQPGGSSYDGRVTFVRLRWGSDFDSFRSPARRGGGAAWNHDYPRAESHLARIVKELTSIDMRTDASLILSLDDPELLKYPIAFMWEPGFWNLTDREALAFRTYLLKGGFAVFEDFDGPEQWRHFETQMRRVLPEARWVKLDASHPIFDNFFKVKDPHGIVHPMIGIAPSYYAIFEDNDPSRRLVAVANFDNDIPEYWEWSGDGFYPVDTSNEAYKIGVNYLIYGLTH